MKAIQLGLLAIIVTTSLSVPVQAAPNDAIPNKISVSASNFKAPGEAQAIRVDVPGNTPAPRQQLAYGSETTPTIVKNALPLDQIDFYTNFITSYNKNIPRFQANVFAEAILGFSQYYKVDPRLVVSMIAVESSFRTDAISSSGAIGLGQLKPSTASWLGVSNPYDPIENIGGMTRYLSWLLSRYNGSLDHAVSAYYQGPGTIDRKGITDPCLPYLLKINNVLARFSGRS